MHFLFSLDETASVVADCACRNLDAIVSQNGLVVNLAIVGVRTSVFLQLQVNFQARRVPLLEEEVVKLGAHAYPSLVSQVRVRIELGQFFKFIWVQLLIRLLCEAL